MKHIHTFESFFSESAKHWKVAYAGKGFYGVTNGGKIEGEMSKEDAEKEAEKRNSANESIINEASFTENMDDATKAVYREYTQMIPDKIKTHDALKSALDKDPTVKQLKSDRTLRTALAWALTYAQEMER